jgi:hypothetical protein
VPATLAATEVRAADGGSVTLDVRCQGGAPQCSGKVKLLRPGKWKTSAVRFDTGGTGHDDATVQLPAPVVQKLVARGRQGADAQLKSIGTSGPAAVRTVKVKILAPLVSDGLPPVLPPGPASHAYALWTPGATDTCPQSVHDRFAVIGPDGKRYPTWHPPTVTNPATGLPCTFGHEHGGDPRGSEIFEWVVSQLAASGSAEFAGLPFGYAAEELDEYAQANPGTTPRHEDHVGHKVDFANNIGLTDDSGTALGVTCDVLFKVHQGTHSADALGNNVHELLYAARCSDGTDLISTTMSTFGAPNEFNRACHPEDVATGGTALDYPSGGGARLIPDRGCVETYVLVGTGQKSSYWALYENWLSENELVAANGERLAFFNPAFAVANPSRYGFVSQPSRLGRTLDVCWETEPNGDRANREPCDTATGVGTVSPFPFDDSRSPFDGGQRDFFLDETTLANEGGPTRWYTDPYGRNGSTEPFPGAVCQIVGAVDTTDRPALSPRKFTRDYGGDGVHSPN